MSQATEFPVALRELSETEFVNLFGGVYEHSVWVAEAVADKRNGETDTLEGLAAAMAALVESAGHDAQLALIRAHPDLAGRAAVGGALTAASSAEQASAGLDQCTPVEYERLQALNTEYRAKFGFPFVLAVRGRTRADIITVFEDRLGNDSETEFRTALDEIHKIARLRLQAIARILNESQ